MTFVLEVNNKGKDIILYNDYKYREGYPVKNGDIVWRCLGKICKGSIRTNREKTAIYSAKESHTGPHPVTMRHLTSTPPIQSCSQLMETSMLAGNSETPCASTSTPVTHYTSEALPTTLDYSKSLQLDPLAVCDLREVNSKLREELAKLREEMRVILDHSVESDQRLLQYTDTVFLPPASMVASTSPNIKNPLLENKHTQTDCKDESEQDQVSNKSIVIQDSFETAKGLLEKENLAIKNSLTKLQHSFDSLMCEKKSTESLLSERENDLARLSTEIKQLKESNLHFKHLVSELKGELQNSKSWGKNNWLCDSIIQSYFDEFGKSNKKSQINCLFMGPSVTQLIRHGDPNDIGNILLGLDFVKYDYIFCCVSDSLNPGKDDSGSHWSLLILDKTNSKAYHLDSLAKTNLASAQIVALNLGTKLDSFVEVPCVQQSNNFECGLNVLLNT